TEYYCLEWTKPFMNDLTADVDRLVGKSLHVLSEELIPLIKETKTNQWVQLGGKTFQVTIRKGERLLYLFERTEQRDLQVRYHNEQTILAIIYLDNYEEITQNM